MLRDPEEGVADNMRALAGQTGGEYVVLRSPADMGTVWQVVEGDRAQGIVEFEMASSEPTTLNVEVALPSGESYVGSTEFAGVDVAPAEVTIASPAADAVVERTAESAESTLVEMTPRTVDVRAELAWPGGNQRELERVEYWVNGNLHATRTEAPFTEIELPIAELGSGAYDLQVRVIDALGIVGESEAQPLTISTVVPAAPAPTRSPLSAMLSLAALLLALGMLLLAFVLWRRRRRQGELDDPLFALMDDYDETTDADAHPAEDYTEPDVNIFPPAVLTYVRGGAHLPQELALYDLRLGGPGENEIKVGRSSDYCSYPTDHVLEDKRLSRWHATVLCEEGDFFLRDEGSSGGTYVNRKRLRARQPQKLEHGDIINFNTLTYRFESVDEEIAEAGRRYPQLNTAQFRQKRFEEDAQFIPPSLPAGYVDAANEDETHTVIKPAAAPGAQAYEQPADDRAAEPVGHQVNGYQNGHRANGYQNGKNGHRQESIDETEVVWMA